MSFKQTLWSMSLVVALGGATGAGVLASPPTKSEKSEPASKGTAREKMLREKVGLDEAKTKKMVALLDAQKAARKPFREAIKSANAALKDLVKANKADDAAYASAIAKLQAEKDKLDGVEKAQRAEVAKLLTPREQARWMVLGRKGKKDDKSGKDAAKSKKATDGKSDKGDDEDHIDE